MEAKRWRMWLEKNFETGGCEPLIQETLAIVARLSQIREQIAKDGLIVNGRRNLMIDQELKLSAQLLKLWRVLGLADAPPEERRAPGRPTNAERAWRA